MINYDKILYLKDLASDLWDSEAMQLCDKSLEILLTMESKQPEDKERLANRRALIEARADIEWKATHKARIVWKRYLSSWELEIEYRDINGESFVKLYDSDSYEYIRNKKFEESYKARLELQKDCTIEHNNNKSRLGCTASLRQPLEIKLRQSTLAKVPA